MITTRIEIKPHLAEYAYGKFSMCQHEPVRFPSSLDIYHTIWDLLQKRPDNAGVDTGNLEIVLPVSKKTEERDGVYKGKDPVSYNYLGERAAKIIQRKLEVMMFAELHDLLDENKHKFGIEYIETVYGFLNKYMINSISEDALIKNYYRWREVLRRKKLRRKYTKNVSEEA